MGTQSGNPSNLDALSGKYADNGRDIKVKQPGNAIELTNNAPVTTGATNTTPYGFATADQGDDLVACVIEMRAALIAAGICIDASSNAD